jgi:hypothetical protein
MDRGKMLFLLLVLVLAIKMPSMGCDDVGHRGIHDFALDTEHHHINMNDEKERNQLVGVLVKVNDAARKHVCFHELFRRPTTVLPRYHTNPNVLSVETIK